MDSKELGKLPTEYVMNNWTWENMVAEVALLSPSAIKKPHIDDQYVGTLLDVPVRINSSLSDTEIILVSNPIDKPSQFVVRL